METLNVSVWTPAVAGLREAHQPGASAGTAGYGALRSVADRVI